LGATLPAADFGVSFTIDPLSKGSAASKDIANALKLVFESRYKDILPQPVIEKMANQEKSLEPSRCVYLIFREPETRKPKMVIRLYDVSPHEDAPSVFKSTVRENPEGLKLPLEMSFPDLKLPEREKDGRKAHLFELGRMAADSDIMGGVRPSFEWMAIQLQARYDKKIPEEAMIYVAATREGAQAYSEKFGFQVAYSPETHPFLKGDPDQVILKMSVRDFCRRFRQGPGRVNGGPVYRDR
jgi:hypothetical protein